MKKRGTFLLFFVTCFLGGTLSAASAAASASSRSNEKRDKGEYNEVKDCVPLYGDNFYVFEDIRGDDEEGNIFFISFDVIKALPPTTFLRKDLWHKRKIGACFTSDKMSRRKEIDRRYFGRHGVKGEFIYTFTNDKKREFSFIYFKSSVGTLLNRAARMEKDVHDFTEHLCEILMELEDPYLEAEEKLLHEKKEWLLSIKGRVHEIYAEAYKDLFPELKKIREIAELAGESEIVELVRVIEDELLEAQGLVISTDTEEGIVDLTGEGEDASDDDFPPLTER